MTHPNVAATAPGKHPVLRARWPKTRLVTADERTARVFLGMSERMPAEVWLAADGRVPDVVVEPGSVHSWLGTGGEQDRDSLIRASEAAPHPGGDRADT